MSLYHNKLFLSLSLFLFFFLFTVQLEGYPRISTSWHKSSVVAKVSALTRSSTHERLMSSYVRDGLIAKRD